MTELSDDRVERMRAAVLDTVQADVRRRGRRTRRLLSGLAAGCFVVAVGGLGAATLTGGPTQGGGAESSSAADVAVEPAPEVGGGASDSGDRGPGDPRLGDAALLDSPDATTYSGGVESLSGDSAPRAGEPDGDLFSAPGDGDRARDVVTTGTATVRVDDPRRTADALVAFVDDLGGRADQRTETDAGRDSSATLVLRVPAGRVDGTVAELRTHGDVTDVDIARENVTTARTDLDARIRSLTVSVERLRDIAADARTTDGLLRVEEALSARQAELESLQSQRETLGDRVAFSTLTVELVPTERAGGVEPGGFGDGLTTGWNALVATVDGLVHLVGVLAPWLGVVAVASLVWWAVRRRRRA